MSQQPRDLVVRRLAATMRATALYASGHPLLARNVGALFDTCSGWLRDAPSLGIGFLDGEVIVDGVPVRQAADMASTLGRGLARHGVEKIVFGRGITRDELRLAIDIIGRTVAKPADAARDVAASRLASRLADAGVHHVSVGAIEVGNEERVPPGIQAAMRVYDSALRAVQAFWDTARAGGVPDTAAARKVVGSLAQVVNDDRPSVMALTTLKRHDAYTFTHMVNVSILTMAVARALGLDPGLVREFGLAALMHDIGKTRTPLDVLNKPGRLSPDEMATIRRHVVDGAEMLWDFPDMPRLAAIVAFEHHLRVDFTGYPEGVASRRLNLCTLIVSIADVFDALRTTRPYRKALATERVRDMLAEQRGTAFHPALLKQFIRVVGLFPVGSLVRLDTGAVAIVTHAHPEDPFRPQVKVVQDPSGRMLEQPQLVNTWALDGHPPGIVEAVEPADVGLDPLTLL
ncbi:MAG: HD-GYP domain-containing protein [Bacteroidales bacterium]